MPEQLEEIAEEEQGEVRKRDLNPEEEFQRRLALAQIRQWGDPALRMRAREVETFDADLARLAERMGTLMRQANGVGLAATQVGVLRRLFVFQTADDERPVAVVNPVLVARSEEAETDEEGCLSLRDVLVPVERSVTVMLEGQDVAGADLRLELAGIGARVVQHEIDHLDGVLILDRTDRESRRNALKALRPPPTLD